MISKQNAEHYVWGNHCDGWRLIDEPERSIIHERMPPGTSEVRHIHHHAKQFFFVLAGTMTIELDGAEYHLNVHEGMNVPSNIPHQVFNKSDQDIEFLVISNPNSRNDRKVIESKCEK